MAAHSVTALTELAYQMMFSEPNWAQYLHAIDYAPWGNELEFEDWGMLRAICRAGLLRAASHQEALQAVLPVLARQIAKWQELHCPANHEEWRDNKEVRYATVPG